MSGFAVLKRWDEHPLAPNACFLALECLVHLGQDGQTVLSADAQTHIAYCHFAYYPQQPFQVGHQDGYFIAADIRLDNAPTLRYQLGLDPATTDYELVLAAYRHWGRACADKLVGDFAFAIWDSHERALYAARDVGATRPFYYFFSPTLPIFACANDLESLLHLPDIPEVWNTEQTRLAIANETIYFEATCFDHIQALLGGHDLWAKDGRVEVNCFWNPQALPTLKPKQEADVVQLIRQTLSQAVERRVTGQTRLATHLSGGLDSSSLASLAVKLTQASAITGYTWYDLSQAQAYPPTDERAHIPQLSQALGIAYHYEPLQVVDYQQNWHIDGAVQYAQLLMNEHSVVRHSHQHHNRLVIAGWGGDHTLNARHIAKAAALWMQGRPLQALQQTGAGASFRQGNLGMAFERLWANLGVYLGPRRWYAPTRRRKHRQELTPYRPYFFFRNPHDTPTDLTEQFYFSYRLRDNQLQAIQRQLYALRNEAWYKQGKRYGVAYAFPFLDKDVIALAIGLSSTLGKAHLPDRYYFRRAAEAWLPPEMVWQVRKTLSSAPKLNPQVHEHGQAALRDHARQHPMWEQDNPWVDVPLLRKVILHEVDFDLDLSDKLLRIHRVVHFVYAWWQHQQRLARKSHFVTQTDGYLNR